ncbi:MAG TPA: hypothetical protein VFN21_01115, partial [Acidimicrobiales bacterium]|nr:hypothetical protein [Acidimicrobiales bacterium]
MTQSRRIVLAARPTGMCDADTVRTEVVPVPEPGDSEAVVRLNWISIDPTIRTRMDDAPGYLPPIELGAVIRSGGIGDVAASNNDAYPVGATVFGTFGWQDHALVGGTHGNAQIIPDGVDPTAALSVFGTTGMTAYFGSGAILDACLGQPPRSRPTWSPGHWRTRSSAG